MRFNSKQREKPYQFLLYWSSLIVKLKTLSTGAAWLSPARVVRCLVKSCNERNPFFEHFEESQKTNCENRRKEDYVKSSWPLWTGLDAYYNGKDKRLLTCKGARILKLCLSWDCSLQLENMNEELLVIVDQHATVKLYPSLVHPARHILGIFFT
jgi:hypothetical protein